MPFSSADTERSEQGEAAPRHLLTGPTTESAADSESEPTGYPSLTDFASSHSPLIPTPDTHEPPPTPTDRPSAGPAADEAKHDAPPAAPALPRRRGRQERSPWPDLPIPPTTQTAPLITPPDHESSNPAASRDRPPSRTEPPLRRRPPAARVPGIADPAGEGFQPRQTCDQQRSSDPADRLNPAVPPMPADSPTPTNPATPAFDPESAIETQTLPLPAKHDRPNPPGHSIGNIGTESASPGHETGTDTVAADAGSIGTRSAGPGHETGTDTVAADAGSIGTRSAGPGHETGTDTVDDGGIFYGWILVGAVFIVLAVSSGLGFYNASVILAAASDELDTSVGAVSGAAGLFFAISGLTGFAFSKQMDSVDLRWFFAIGGLIGAIALVGLQWVTSVAALYLFFAVFGVGFALAGLVPGTTLVTRWFDRRRSVALSIASTGLSVGGIVVTPIAAWLIAQRDLAGASPYMAAMWIIGIVPIALLLVRSNPYEEGLLPDGDPPSQLTAPNRSADPPADPNRLADPTATPSGRPSATSVEGDQALGLDFSSARSTRFFIALCGAYAVIFFGQVGAIAQLFKMVLERSDDATASAALAVLAATSVVARLAGGAIVLRVPTKSFTAILAVLQAVALILLAVAPSSPTLILSSAFFGVSIGNLLMLQPLLLAEAFGVKNYGRIYSFNQLFGTIGVAGGPFVLGVLRDAFDYRTAFMVAAAASLTGFAFIVLAGPTSSVQSLWKPSLPAKA